MKRKKRNNQNNNSWDQASKKVNNNKSPPSSPRPLNKNIDSDTTDTSPFTTPNPFNILTADPTIQEPVAKKPPPILIKNIVDYISMCQLI
jgi:hypothetical protein